MSQYPGTASLVTRPARTLIAIAVNVHIDKLAVWTLQINYSVRVVIVPAVYKIIGVVCLAMEAAGQRVLTLAIAVVANAGDEGLEVVWNGALGRRLKREEKKDGRERNKGTHPALVARRSSLSSK